MEGKTEGFLRIQQENHTLLSLIQQYKAIFDQAFEPFILTDGENQICFVNQPACSLFQETEENLLAAKITDLFTGAVASTLSSEDSYPYTEGKYQWKIQLRDGAIKSIECIVLTLNIEGHKLYKIKDITSEHLAEQEKQMSMKMFKDMFHQAVDCIVIYDSSGIVMDVNDAFCQALQLEKRQIVGKNINTLVTAAYIEEWHKGIIHVHHSGSYKGDVEMASKGKVISFDYTTSSNNMNGLFMSIFRNVTERRIMEQKLKKSERITQELLEQSMDAILFSDKNNMIFRVNDAACKIFENNKDDLVGGKICHYIHKKDENYKQLLEHFAKEGSVRGELFFKMPNKQIKLLELTSKKHEDEGYNLTILRNVSERWRIETELRNSERKFRKIFEGSLDGMILWKTSEFIDINEAGLKILELSKQELLRISIHSLVEQNSINRKPLQNHLEMVFRNGSETSVIPLVMRNGKTKHIEISTRENLYSGLHLTIIRDVTENLVMQEQIRKSDTLSVVGELAAGIAHEIRNPMTAVKGFIQLLQTSVKEDFSTYFHVIMTELNRIETIITEFLVLAKPQAVHYFSQNINSIMLETLELMGAQALLENIQFESDFEEKEFHVFCEANQLKQVFINILKNAIEVMPSGGIVRVKTRRWGTNQVQITITDEGQGIPEEKIKKLGEPFYTTKERGTGLGLMVSYKIIEEHSGMIKVESEIGKGSSFHIRLPLYKEKNK